VVCDDQPFMVIKGINLWKLLRLLNLATVMPSADTIWNDIVESFTKEQELMQKTLQVQWDNSNLKKLAVADNEILL